MNAQQFDRWVSSLATSASRRRVIAGLAGAALAGLGSGRIRPQETSAGSIDFTGRFCGGIAGIPCPPGYECVDDPGDDCAPPTGADCGGVCRRIGSPNPCATILCRRGSECCPNCGGICVPIGTPCSDDLCVEEPCGDTICGPGTYCCNESCGICAPLDGGCIQQSCGGEPCDQSVCGAGRACCTGRCVSLANDQRNCGQCGKRCRQGQTCRQGRCS